MKRQIRLTESDLHRIVKNTLNEVSDKLLFNALEKSDLYTQWGGDDGYYNDIEKHLLRASNDIKYLYRKTPNNELIAINDEIKKIINRISMLNSRKRKQFNNFNNEYENRGKPFGQPNSY